MDINTIQPQSGRLYKEDGSAVNQADILADVYDPTNHVLKTSVALNAAADWQWTTDTTAIIASVTTAMSAAGVAGIKNYCTGLQYQNSSATPTLVSIQDGTANIAVFNAPALMTTPAIINFPAPLSGTAATAMNFNVVTTGASIYANAQGYQAP